MQLISTARKELHDFPTLFDSSKFIEALIEDDAAAPSRLNPPLRGSFYFLVIAKLATELKISAGKRPVGRARV